MAFGPGPHFKGGISNYNTSLAKALERHGGTEVHIVSWTQQYPAIIPRDYIDRKSKDDLLEGTRVRVHYLLNYNRNGKLLFRTWGGYVCEYEDEPPAGGESGE